MKVVAAVALCLLGCELGLRVAEPRLSADVQHIRHIPAIISEFEQKEGPRILFLGNSLTRAGIRPDTMTKVWSDAKLPEICIERIYPDDTTILDWLYLYRTAIEPMDSKLDLLVVTFALNHLDDHQPINPERLGGQLAGLAAAPEAFAQDVLSFEDRIRYLLSGVSRLWAARERIQTRVLALIPGYRTLAQVVNTDLRNSEKRDVPRAPESYQRLARFIANATRHGTSVVFVAAPMPRRYSLPGTLRDTVHRGGAELIDLQNLERLGPDDFPDGYHLSEGAAARFSESLAQAMAQSAYVRAAIARAGSPSSKPKPVGASVRTELQ